MTHAPAAAARNTSIVAVNRINLVENAGIAKIFRDIADMLETKRDSIFKIRAYRKAASSIETMAEPLEQLVRENRLGEVAGVGEAIAKKISELVSTGKLEYYRKLKAEIRGATGNTTTANLKDKEKGAR
jgi:DNA polymerase/3'-5' exonuclease PolX